MAASLFKLGEYYRFVTNDETSIKINRRPDSTVLEVKDVEYFPGTYDENSIQLKGKDISITIGERLPKIKAKHVGTFSITDEDVYIEVAYEQKKFDQFLNFIDINGLKNNFVFFAIISQNELKKKQNKNYDDFLLESFLISNTLSKK